MKIMYFLHEGGEYFNGASRSALALIRANAAAGNSNIVVIPAAGGRLEEELRRIANTEILVVPSYRWKDFRRERPVSQLYYRLRYLTAGRILNRVRARRLARTARERGVSLVHSNSSVIDLGARTAKYAKLPHIWHFREFGEEDFGMFPYGSERGFYREVERLSSAVVCVSEAVKNKLAAHVDEKKLRVIYNGVPLPAKLPPERERDGTVNVLISGVISEKKGQRTAVEALHRLSGQGIDNVRLTVAGRGRAAGLGDCYERVSDRVRLSGFCDDMAGLRKTMDIELMCSVSEAFGRTVVEAMAAGLIIIGAAAGAAPELIDNGVTGFLFPPGDAEALAERILAAMRLDEAELAAMRERAYASVCEKFSESRYTGEVLALYHELISRETI